MDFSYGGSFWNYAIYVFFALTVIVTLAMIILLRQKATADRRQYEEDVEKYEGTKQENEKRAEGRREHFRVNPPVIFCTSRTGELGKLQAALPGPLYEKLAARSANLYLQGEWDHRHTIAPDPTNPVCLFADYKIAGVYSSAVGHEYREDVLKGKIYRARLEQFAQEHGAKIFYVDNIFVPLQNQSVLSYDRQLQCLRKRSPEEMIEFLIMSQAPEELRPLPLPPFPARS